MAGSQNGSIVRDTVQIIHLGGENGVTGSCHLLQVRGMNILVDCGLAQGRDPITPLEAWPVPPAQIDFLFLTHAHIDHIGRVPELVQNGFRSEILTTHGTKALLRPMLEDALTFSDLPPREAVQIIDTITDLCWGFEYGQTFELHSGVRFQFGRTGHILGSCCIRLEWENPSYSVVFSGDLGARRTPLLPDPDIPEPCDLLVLESTYGDRLHADRTQRLQRLGEVLSRSLSDRGKVLIPAFALGRTQELLYEMDRLFTDPVWQERFPALRSRRNLRVFLDSPLGLEVTKVYSRLRGFWDKEARQLLGAGDDPLNFQRLYGIGNYRAHRELLAMEGPAVIVAGSGMCTGGRIVAHLQAGIEDPRNDILFVGYQAQGTPGRKLLETARNGAGRIRIGHATLPVRAGVHELAGYSAHADQKELVEWAQAIGPGKVKLVHGEARAQAALEQILGCG